MCLELCCLQSATIQFVISYENLKNAFNIVKNITVWKVSKYGVLSGPYFPVFGPNTGKYGPEKTLHFDTFHVVIIT